MHAAKASEAYHAARNKDLEAAWGELAAKEKAVHAGSRAAAMTARAALIKEHRTQAKEMVRTMMRGSDPAAAIAAEGESGGVVVWTTGPYHRWSTVQCRLLSLGTCVCDTNATRASVQHKNTTIVIDLATPTPTLTQQKG